MCQVTKCPLRRGFGCSLHNSWSFSFTQKQEALVFGRFGSEGGQEGHVLRRATGPASGLWQQINSGGSRLVKSERSESSLKYSQVLGEARRVLAKSAAARLVVVEPFRRWWGRGTQDRRGGGNGGLGGWGRHMQRVIGLPPAGQCEKKQVWPWVEADALFVLQLLKLD